MFTLQMKWSQTYIGTLRDDPQEAEIPSHKLMLRAGLIRRLAGGLYTFMPLGLKALHKVEQIVREEMDAAGAIEVLMPAIQPRELWDKSDRYRAMGEVMFKVNDRQGRQMVLGPTHEEVMTDLVSREINSYRQLPKTFYQIQVKFRDEIRPRFGLMRSKEFIMKDAYSFDTDWDNADSSYQAMYDAYQRIFDRCGLRTKVVEADTGAMGGNWSHEFMVLADAGEDGIVECDSCDYAANLEKAERCIEEKPAPAPGDGPEEIGTPNARTIEEVASFLKCNSSELIKTLIYIVDGKPTAILIPGNREINEHKIISKLEASSVELADDITIEKATGAPVGFAGPVGLNIPVYADTSLKSTAGLISGANKADTHLKNICLERDASVKGYIDLALAADGDTCPRCKKGKLREKRGIEVGHVFKLGTKYSEAFGACYLDEDGKQQPAVMGCYGIGVTRVLQSVIEQSHDEKGIIWPLSISPFHVAILVLNTTHKESMDVATKLLDDLQQLGIDVLMDDRDERPGVKFKDAELIGFPVRVVIGEKSLASGEVEITLRKTGSTERVKKENALKQIQDLCGSN